ncbi:MAG: class I SAM-dependent methyltransferase [Fimbriimonas sp.]|nr:class I SAM-dependent methyltransferase [Fimbriimonas sp.]
MNPAQSSFGPVAPYYDELMRFVPYRMWIGYYFLLLAQQDIHPKKILDVCCGTGTMCQMLTREGFDVSGFDLSPGMIEAAREKAASKKLAIRYEVMDAAELSMGETYDSAYSFFDSLNNILDPARLQLAFERIGAHLVPGGSFIFDLNTSVAFEERMFDQENLRSNAKLRYKWVGDWNNQTRLITVDMRFWHGGAEFRETHVQRAYEMEEIFEMLRLAGFEQVHAYHSYTLNPPRPMSDRLHYTAVRS